jgi:hypothetical protein
MYFKINYLKKAFFLSLILFLFLNGNTKAQTNIHSLKEDTSNIHTIKQDQSNIYTLYKDYLNLHYSPFYQESPAPKIYESDIDLLLVRDSTNKITKLIYFEGKPKLKKKKDQNW